MLEKIINSYNGNYEDGKKLYNNVARTISTLFSVYTIKYIEGTENMVLKGPNLIIGTHERGALDVADLIKKYPRQLFFTANKDFFDRETALKTLEKSINRNFGKLGELANMLLKPLAYAFFSYISPRMIRVGSIPVDIRGGRNDEAKEAIKQYISQNRDGAFVFLQYRKKEKHERGFYPIRAIKNCINKDIIPKKKIIVRRGGLKLFVDLYDDGKGVDIPVTLVTMKTSLHVIPPMLRATIKISPPDYISNYHVPGDPEYTFQRCHQGLERKLQEMYSS